MTARQQVAVVTGGGGGIGAAIAEELGRTGWFVVTVDPLVTVDGAEQLPEPDETTAGRIVAAGGSARASSVSVTDADAVRGLFHELVAERGGLDAVVNVAGITRPTGFAHGSESDWLAVLTVHLQGYLNILDAALPLMAAARHGHILGVTSGSGWRAADAGAYSCAKRAVASITWQIGRQAPPGVTVNAMSPIAATRMVTAALARAGRAANQAGGGLSLTAMPDPADLGPFGAYLAGDRFGWCSGRVLFAGGSEVAVIEEPRLLEVVRTEGATSLSRVLATVIPKAFGPAEQNEVSGGGGNPRFGTIFDEPPLSGGTTGIRSCAVVTDRAEFAANLRAALSPRSVTCQQIAATPPGFEAASVALGAAAASEPIDAIVVATSSDAPVSFAPDGWQRTLDEHRAIVDQIHSDAEWARAAAGLARRTEHPVRLVTVTDARTSGGRSRAQAAAQLARIAASSTHGSVTAFAAGIEAPPEVAAASTAELAAHLVQDPDATVLAGAELVVGPGWIGLRSHPRPIGSVVYGGPALPDWLDATLREVLGVTPDPVHLEVS